MAEKIWDLSDTLELLSVEDLESLGVKDNFLSGDLTPEQKTVIRGAFKERLDVLIAEHHEKILFTEVVLDHEKGTVSLRPPDNANG